MINRVQSVRGKGERILRAVGGLGPLAILIAGFTLPAVSAQSEQKSARADSKPAQSESKNTTEVATSQGGEQQAEVSKKAFPPTSSQMDHDVAEDLRKRREELETRMSALEAREAEVAAKERALEDEIQKLETIRADITRIENASQAVSDEKIAKIVETMEAMSPKASAKMLAEVEEQLAVRSLSQISSGKLAKILSALEPSKSARFTELLAGVSRAKRTVASTSPAAKNPEQKGGETNERNSNQQQLPNAASQRKP